MRKRLRATWLVVATSFRVAPLLAGLNLVLIPLTRVSALAIGVLLKLLTDAVTAGDAATVVGVSTALGSVAGLRSLLDAVDLKIRTTLDEKVGHALERRIIDASTHIPAVEHYENHEYLDRLSMLRFNYGNFGVVTSTLVNNAMTVVTLAGAIVLLASIDRRLLVLPMLGIPTILLQTRVNGRARRAEEASAPHARLADHLYRSGTSAAIGKELRVFNLEDELIRRQHVAFLHRDRILWRADLRSALPSAIAWVAQAGACTVAVWLVARLAIQGHVGLGDVTLTIVVAHQLFRYLYEAVGNVSLVGVLLRNTARVQWLIDYAKQQQRTGTALPPEAINEGIDFDHVSFRYPDTEKWVLRNVSLRFDPGSVVALVGDNGAGKTSLIKLLCGMYQPTGGEIRIDGTSIAELEVDAWRERTSAGFQDFAKFELIVRHVVGVGDLPRMDEQQAVLTALDRAGAADVTARLERGLDTQLGKQWRDGVELSGGQWQKLALGRAFMRHAPLLLVLDEPTSALDPQTEHALFERYAAAARAGAAENGAVTILVSHRFSTVRMADQIVVLDQGRVVEIGSHDELVRRQGLYAELYEIQARQYV